MANSQSFVEHVTDLLSQLGPVAMRRMFGGHGVYHRGLMFGLLSEDELFLKTDEENRPRFLEAGCRPFVYLSQRGPQETSYYRPPDEAHEDPEAMLPWARLALEAALRAAAARRGKAAGKPRTRKPARARTSKPRPGPAAGADRTRRLWPSRKR